MCVTNVPSGEPIKIQITYSLPSGKMANVRKRPVQGNNRTIDAFLRRSPVNALKTHDVHDPQNEPKESKTPDTQNEPVASVPIDLTTEPEHESNLKQAKSTGIDQVSEGKRRFLVTWKQNRPWLVYDSETRSMFCRTCQEANVYNSFTGIGCSILKKENVTLHEKRRGIVFVFLKVK